MKKTTNNQGATRNGALSDEKNGLSLPPVLTLEEAANYLRLAESVVRTLAEQGKLPARQLQEHWRFLRSALDDWLLGEEGYHQRIMRLAGAWAEDDSLDDMVQDIYARRRPKKRRKVTAKN